MKIFVFAIAAFALAANAYPADPKDEVELVRPTNTNVETFDDDEAGDDDKNDGTIPVIIIRTRPTFFSGRPSFFRPPSFFDRHFGFNSGFPLFGSEDEDVGLDDIFGSDSGERQAPEKDSEAGSDDETSKLPCGFLCGILKGLEDHINQLEKDFQATLGRKNKTDNDYDVYNETYTEKTLSDGSVVKINRTVIADSDENGNSFFFHSTSFNNPGTGKEYEDEEAEDVDHEFTDKKERKKEEIPAIEYDDNNAETETASSSTTTTTTTTKPGIVPRIDEEEEKFNDVLADVDKTKNNDQQNNKGVDDGLVTIEAVQ